MNNEISYIAVHPDNVMSVLDQFQTSKEGIEKFAALVVAEVNEGREDSLKVALFMKTLEKIAESVNKQLAGKYCRDAAGYPEKTIALRGAEITLCNTSTKYDYASSGDIEWEMAHTAEQLAINKRKEREEFLRALKTSMTAVNDQTGEVYTISPPDVTRTEGIKISIK